MVTYTKQTKKRPIVLIILDGLGIAEPGPGNAVTLAKTPTLKSIWQQYSTTRLEASGLFVGLPKGVTGNSEVGHFSLGAGRVVFQEIAKINNEIESGEFYKNEEFKKALDHAVRTGGNLHLMGLVSDGRVHSSIDHLFACLEYCRREQFDGKKVFIHAFTDGRDTPPQNAYTYFNMLETKMNEIGVGKLASIIGRYNAMDRDNRWERIQKAYDLIVDGKGTPVSKWTDALKDAYVKNQTDEFLEPYVLTENENPVATVNDGDTIVFFNYRGDRAMQISKAFEDKSFPHFPRRSLNNVYFAGFSNYEKGIVMNRADEDIKEAGGESQMIESLMNEELQKTHGFPEKQIFPPTRIEDSLGKIISDAGLSQLRIAESEKYPHVTYFFNCRQNDPFEREDRIEIPSPKDVATYDLKPEMSSPQVTQTVIGQIQSKKYDFILINYAQTDMVAHTGVLGAAIKCVESADRSVTEVIKATRMAGGEVIITADHGNVEELVNMVTGEKDTKHSVNQVPFMYISDHGNAIQMQPGMLADVAPTMLYLLGVDKPTNMLGRNLIQ